MMQGIIAIDIDGTIIAKGHALSAPVVAFLAHLSAAGWMIMFITGRTFDWAYRVLKILSFPYHLGVQNGAIILEMPSRRILATRYLDRSILLPLDELCQSEASDFVVYGGYEHQDACYYRPQRFSAELLDYLRLRMTALKETWLPIMSFDEMGLETFASVKCFGDETSAMRLAQKIEKKLGLHVPLIRDPFDHNYMVVQATHPLISKGQALKDLLEMTNSKATVIAAGDDRNDLSMLNIADIKVVMSTAPDELLQMADIIAPPASENGIILGLQKALLLIDP